MNTPKQTTPNQMAALGLLSMSLSNVPASYLEMFHKSEQPVAVAAEWLQQIEKLSPGVTEKYWAIVNQ